MVDEYRRFFCKVGIFGAGSVPFSGLEFLTTQIPPSVDEIYKVRTIMDILDGKPNLTDLIPEEIQDLVINDKDIPDDMKTIIMDRSNGEKKLQDMNKTYKQNLKNINEVWEDLYRNPQTKLKVSGLRKHNVRWIDIIYIFVPDYHDVYTGPQMRFILAEETDNIVISGTTGRITQKTKILAPERVGRLSIDPTNTLYGDSNELKHTEFSKNYLYRINTPEKLMEFAMNIKERVKSVITETKPRYFS